MCGRFTLTAEWGLVREWFFIELAEQMERIVPRYNIGPAQDVLAVIDPGGGRERRAGYLRWGLQAPWMKSPLINARAETLHEKPTFRGLLERKRCIIPADGFYEWDKSAGGGKQPMRIMLTDRPLFGFAALYDTYVTEDGTRHHSCVIITTEPNRTMSAIHHRMPAILRREDEAEWLDRSNTDTSQLQKLLQPYDDASMRMYPVSPAVGNVRWDAPECIEEYKS